MNNRTFLRTMLDLFLNNAIIKLIASFCSWRNYHVQKYDFVNFCNNNDYLTQNGLKFFENVPLNKEESQRYNNRFIFSNLQNK